MKTSQLKSLIIKLISEATSDITPERMLRSIYDNLGKKVKVGPFTPDSFDFSVSEVKGNVEARKGKILVSFDKYVKTVQPKQFDIVYEGETVLTKDYVRNKVSKIIGDYLHKYGLE